MYHQHFLTIVVIALSSKTDKMHQHTCAVCHADYHCAKLVRSHTHRNAALINICNIGQGSVWSMHIFVFKTDTKRKKNDVWSDTIQSKIIYGIKFVFYRPSSLPVRKMTKRKWKRKRGKRERNEEDHIANADSRIWWFHGVSCSFDAHMCETRSVHIA